MIPTRLPVLFVSDFGPFPAVENDDYTRDLAKLGEILPRPKAIVIASGHWQSSGAIRVTSAAKPETIHDYSGFPESFYRLSYPCPGDPALADKIVKGLINAQIPDVALAAPTDEHFDPHIHRSIRFGNGLRRVFYFAT